MSTEHSPQYTDRRDAVAALDEIDRVNQRVEANAKGRTTSVIALVVLTSIALAFTAFSMFIHWEVAVWIGFAISFPLLIATFVLSKKLNVSRSSLQDPFERKWSKWSLAVIFLPLSGLVGDIIQSAGYPWWGYIFGGLTAGLCGYCFFKLGMEDLVYPSQQRTQIETSDTQQTEEGK